MADGDGAHGHFPAVQLPQHSPTVELVADVGVEGGEVLKHFCGALAQVACGGTVAVDGACDDVVGGQLLREVCGCALEQRGVEGIEVL